MRYLEGEEKTTAEKYISAAAEVAKQATCERSKCGTVIVNNGQIIGSGFNSPAGNLESQRRCQALKRDLHSKVTDKTCCVHAEQRAIMDALRRQPDRLSGAVLYFTRLSDNGEATESGQPYCTHCSKLALDVGISKFILWHKEGIGAYPTDEYNLLSYQYQE
ncbi:MAG: deaminase [Patescibacteria group bacterium]|jgi:deoxycytidylate deaminase